MISLVLMSLTFCIFCKTHFRFTNIKYALKGVPFETDAYIFLFNSEINFGNTPNLLDYSITYCI